MGDSKETERVLRGYADAWLAGDVERIVGAYHEDVALHYMGESPLAGTHTGRDEVFAALGQASQRTARQLIEIEDVLVGSELGAILAVEDLGDPPRRVRRVLVYRVADGQLRECWLYDEDQRFVDALWSVQPVGV
jgi:ketosteroid isomerase-like protein